MNGSETVGMVIGDDSLDMKLKEDVAKMRTSLSSCSDDRTTTIQSLKTIKSLQIYHQITRLIKYLDMCDRIESKLYECIDCTLLQVDPEDAEHLLLLLQIQERLQRLMVESQKLLEPYLNYDITETIEFNDENAHGDLSGMIDAPTRDRVRLAAQMVITDLVNSGTVQVETETATEQQPVVESKPKKKRGRKPKQSE